MSAITGIFRRDGQNVDPAEIKNMNDKLAHRGLDGSRTWCEGSVAFGHQMLHTTQESLHEELPLDDDESGLVITADARIDNRQELSKELNIEDTEVISDSYYILKAYEKWGENCPDKLLGDFAFAIWDKNNQKLFCARDHMGIKPFYYRLSDNVFFFATELKTLKYQKEVPLKLNELRIADYLISLTQDKEITFYDNIFRLPPASFLNISVNKSDKSCYWNFDPNKETIMGSDEEYALKFLELFTEAVSCRMRSSFPIGFLLSGGLDSSSIVSTARKILEDKNSDRRLETFSLVFDDLIECDEREYINKVISLGNLEPNFCNADNFSPLSEIDEILAKVGEPFNVPNTYLSWEIYQNVEKKDIRILFDGFDGDSTVFYEERYALDLFREMNFNKLFKEIKFMAKWNGITYWEMFILAIIFPLTPDFFKNLIQKVLDHLNINLSIIEESTIDIVKNEFIRTTNLENRYQMLYKDPLSKASTNKLRHHFAISSGILQHAMEIFDVIAGNFSFNHVYPFFDVRLVEFCLSIPKEQKFSKMWDRIVMRRAMENILPAEIQWRTTKGNLSLNFRRNMLFYDKETLDKIIFKDDEITRNFINQEYLIEIYNKYKDDFTSVDPLYMWLPIVLSI
ncbi:MAG TPA: lasso peptide isopeptide bond-forming cyclase, partial [Methanobacterium sp.]|nr:lasso peptide isopeptide bond-forming cyclase [Methanobacterium sp.]